MQVVLDRLAEKLIDEGKYHGYKADKYLKKINIGLQMQFIIHKIKQTERSEISPVLYNNNYMS